MMNVLDAPRKRKKKTLSGISGWLENERPREPKRVIRKVPKRNEMPAHFRLSAYLIGYGVLIFFILFIATASEAGISAGVSVPTGVLKSDGYSIGYFAGYHGMVGVRRINLTFGGDLIYHRFTRNDGILGNLEYKSYLVPLNIGTRYEFFTGPISPYVGGEATFMYKGGSISGGNIGIILPKFDSEAKVGATVSLGFRAGIGVIDVDTFFRYQIIKDASTILFGVGASIF